MMRLIESRAGSPLRASRLACAAIVLTTLLPSTAAAQSTFTTEAVNLRAGPDRSFPLVTWFPPRTQVRVFGCTTGWRWCDVAARGWRGWVELALSRERFARPYSGRLVLGGALLGRPLSQSPVVCESIELGVLGHAGIQAASAASVEATLHTATSTAAGCARAAPTRVMTEHLR